MATVTILNVSNNAILPASNDTFVLIGNYDTTAAAPVNITVTFTPRDATQTYSPTVEKSQNSNTFYCNVSHAASNTIYDINVVIANEPSKTLVTGITFKATVFTTTSPASLLPNASLFDTIKTLVTSFPQSHTAQGTSTKSRTEITNFICEIYSREAGANNEPWKRVSAATGRRRVKLKKPMNEWKWESKTAHELRKKHENKDIIYTIGFEVSDTDLYLQSSMYKAASGFGNDPTDE